MDTEIVDKLFLELSQFTKAKTEHEIKLIKRVEILIKENEQLRNAFRDAVLSEGNWFSQFNSLRKFLQGVKVKSNDEDTCQEWQKWCIKCQGRIQSALMLKYDKP